MSKIYSIIVSYNGEKWLKKCINSLLSSSIQTEIIVVDNNSTDDTVKIIETNFKKVMLLKQENNLGFGHANNIGISHALKKGAEYIFLINQDVSIEEGCLEKLISASKRNEGFGILSPVHFNWEGTQLENYFSRFAAVNKDFYSDYILKQPLKETYQVPFVNAAAWLIPKKALLEVGGFDPIFYHYGEDNNYCQRLQYHGFKVGIVPNTAVYHDSDVRNEPKDYLFSRAYFHNEVKDLQLTYGDINKDLTSKDFLNVKKHLKKLILINLLKFKPRHVKGYLKKYKIFEQAFKNIKRSRSLNTQKSTHYLEY